MREAVGSTWIFGLVISFTVIFAGFLVLALAYSKAYKIKNEMTSIIEKYEGVTLTDSLNGKGSLEIINQYLINSGYSTMGKCPSDSYGNDDLTSNTLEYANNNSKYYYCISYDTNPKNCHTLFKVTVFYNFNLPVLGQLTRYNITGQSNEIFDAYFMGKQINCSR